MISEAIVLAGGFGTRLQSEISDRPKCLAPVNNIPFLSYLIHYLLSQDISHFIFSLGYKSEMIIDFLNTSFAGLSYTLSIEDTPLGTGGAILLACEKTNQPDVLICNGDTLYKAEVLPLFAFHKEMNAACTLALKPMDHFERYGAVSLDADGRIVSFHEKKYCKSGLINGGMYVLNTRDFMTHVFEKAFSFETDYLGKNAGRQGSIFGNIQDGFFIDIGIPEDYRRASGEREMKNILL